MKLWQKRMTSSSLRPCGSRSAPPFAPPIRQTRQRVLEDLLEAGELMMPRFTDGWKRRPRSQRGPSALLYWTRKPRLMRILSRQSCCQGTRKMTCRSGSHSELMRRRSMYSGCCMITGPSGKTSRTAGGTRGSPVRRTTLRTGARGFSSRASGRTGTRSWGVREGSDGGESRPRGSGPESLSEPGGGSGRGPHEGPTGRTATADRAGFLPHAALRSAIASGRIWTEADRTMRGFHFLADGLCVGPDARGGRGIFAERPILARRDRRRVGRRRAHARSGRGARARRGDISSCRSTRRSSSRHRRRPPTAPTSSTTRARRTSASPHRSRSSRSATSRPARN